MNFSGFFKMLLHVHFKVIDFCNIYAWYGERGYTVMEHVFLYAC